MKRSKKPNTLYEVYQSSMKSNKKYLGSQKKWELLQIEDVKTQSFISACGCASLF